MKSLDRASKTNAADRASSWGRTLARLSKEEAEKKGASRRDAGDAPDVSPQKQKPTTSISGANVHADTIQGAIALLDGREAAAKKAFDGFLKLPAAEQNAFLAEARGLSKSTASTESTSSTPSPVQEIALDLIDRSPFNREHFDPAKSAELIESVRKHGVMQPGCARPSPKVFGRFELIYGERRFRAAGEAGLRTMPLKIVKVSDEEAIEIQAIENLQREDLNPLDEGIKYQQYIQACEKRGMKPTEAVLHVAARLDRGKTVIYDRLRLVKLPEFVKQAIWAGQLPASHAALLGELEHNRDIQEETARIILKPDPRLVEEGTSVLSFRSAKQLVGEMKERCKKLAGYNQLRDTFIKKGNLVLSHSDNRKLCPNGHYLDPGKDFVKATQYCYDTTGPVKQWKDLMGKHTPDPVLAQDLSEGEAVILYPARQAREAAVRNGIKFESRSSGSSGSEKASEKARKAAEARKKKAQTERINQVVAKLRAPHTIPPKELWRTVAEILIEKFLHGETDKFLCKNAGIAKEYGNGPIKKLVATLPTERDLQAFVFEFLCAPNWYGSETGAKKLATLLGIRTSGKDEDEG